MPEFNPDVEVGASLATRWRKWLMDFDMFLAASGITSNARKRALLLYQAGSRVRDIFAQLPDTGEANDFETAKEKLTQHFQPQKNVRYDVYVFRKAFQQKDETLDQYHTCLRTLAEPCEFTNLDFELEEQIIIGGTSTRIRKQALRDPSYDLKAMLLDGRRDEISKFQSAEIEGKEQMSKLSAKPKNCLNCGGPSPHLNTCPAKGKECHNCGKMNHFAKYCRGKPKKGHKSGQSRSQNFSRSRQRTQVKQLVHAQSDTDDEYLYPVRDSKTTRPHATIKVLGHSFDILIDTGASINVIDHGTFLRMKDAHLLETRAKAFPYSSSKPVTFKGKFQAVIETKKRYAVATFFVINSSNSGNLLSAQTAQELGLISLNLCKLAANNTPNLPQKQDKALTSIVNKYSNVFNGLGKLKHQQITLNIDETVQPTAEAQRRIPYHIREKVKHAIHQLVADDIIEKVPHTQATPWISAIVAVPKKDGTVRICVDMRKANCAIQRVRYLIPTVADISQALNGCKFFSKLDLSQAYHQLELDERSRYITTFSTHFGLYRYKRLNYGTNAAAELFQHTLQTVLHGLDGVRNLADDIIIFAKTREDHDQALSACLQRLADHGLTLNASKCKLLTDSLSFFGQVFTAEGTTPDPARVLDLQNALVPTNVHEVRSFLGMANYSSRYIPNYATITEPLRVLTKKNARFTWTSSHQTAFDHLKKALTRAPVMSYFDTTKETFITVDASPVGISAILSQQGSDADTPQVVAYASRALTSVEQRYSQTEKEALGIVWGIEHFHLYIYGSHFTLITDHKPLEVIYGNVNSKPSARIERWVLRLQPYSFSVVYKPGKDNPADFLSRHPSSESISKHAVMADEYVSLLALSAVPKAMTISDIQKATDADKTMQSLRAAIRHNKWDCDLVKPFRVIKDELIVAPQNIVLRGSRIVVPESLQQQAIDIAHETHQGLVKTKALLREKVWFPGIDKLVKETLDRCIPCQATGQPNPPEPIRMTPMPDGPWQKVHADFYGPLPSGEYLLVLIDRYSRYPEVEIVRSTKASVVIPKFDKIFATHGIPFSITTDNRPPFNSEAYRRYLHTLGISYDTATPKWPQGTAEVERFNQPLGRALITAKVEGRIWQQELNRFLLQYRTTPHATTKIAPSDLLFNRVVNGKLPTLVKNKTINRHKEAVENERLRAEYNKVYADKKRHAKPCDIKVGDYVLIKQDKQNKLTPRFNEKPLIVVHRNKSRITVEDNDKRKITRNVSHFKRILTPSNLENEANSEPETKQHKDGDDDYDNNDAKRTDNVGERQRLVARRSDRLRKEPDRLGVPIPSQLVR